MRTSVCTGRPPKGLGEQVGFAGGRIVERACADDSGSWEQVGVEIPEVMQVLPHRSPTLPAE